MATKNAVSGTPLVQSGVKRDRFVLYLPDFVAPAPKRRRYETRKHRAKSAGSHKAVRISFRLTDEGAKNDETEESSDSQVHGASPSVGVEESFVVVAGQCTSDKTRRTSWAFASAVRETAIDLLRAGKAGLAFRYLDVMLSFLRKNAAEPNVYVACLHRVLGLMYEGVGDFDSAVQCWHTALDEERVAVSCDSEAALLDLHKISTICLRKGDADGALEYLNERASYLCEAVSRASKNDRSSDGKRLALGKTFKNLADAHMLLGDVDEAILAMTESARFYKEAGKEWVDEATFSSSSMHIYSVCNSRPDAAPCA